MEKECCKNCEWHFELQDKGKLPIPCAKTDTLFFLTYDGEKCIGWQKQQYPIPRPDWRGPTWNY